MPEREIMELRLAVSIEADDLAVENTAAILTKIGKTLERVSIARDKPDAIFVRIKDCPESVPFNLKNPVRMREWRTGAASRQWLESGRKGH